MRRIRLGRAGPEVSAIGFGAWGLSGDYGPADDSESIDVIRRALDLGVDLIDTADEYGAGHNERLVGRAIRGRRDQVVLATKVGLVHGPNGAFAVCGRSEYVTAALEASLGRLGVDHVDLLYLHRVDPEVPVEETVGSLAQLVRAGKARHLGLCEVGAQIVRRAHAIHPLAAVQSEYSLWTRDPEADVIPALEELGIGFVGFSPLGRGFLTGVLERTEDLGARDFRRRLPRFKPENLARNVRRLEPLRALAAEKGATPAQLALVWLVHRAVVPIPGTRRADHLESNLRALDLTLAPEELARLEEAFPPGWAAGERYPASLATLAQHEDERQGEARAHG
jgi:aryl-alcohol dehydrogenase-like predicted oxidoreductase